MRKISDEYVMPNVWLYRDAFNKAKQWGTLAIPATIGKGAFRGTDPNSTIYNTIFESKPSKSTPSHTFIIEKDMKNHY
jgi:hypothetical protein